jgi:HSP20 family protein
MNVPVKRNGGLPSLFSNFFGSSLFDRDFFDVGSELFTSRLGINVPTANVSETSKEYKIELAAPGLDRKDFKVEIENNTLTISAEKEEEKKEGDGGYSKREYSFNSFSRSFALPDNVREGNIDAKYENGVLRIMLPKEKETPAKIARKVDVL